MALRHLGDSNCLTLSPRGRIWVQFRSIFMMLDISRKVGFLVDFEFSMAVLGVGRVPIGLVAPLRFKWLDSQPDSSNMGPVSTDFHEFCDFLKSWGGFLTRYLSCFRPGCFTIHIFQVFGRDQKEPRRKVTQIRGGITSGSAFFDCFRPI